MRRLSFLFLLVAAFFTVLPFGAQAQAAPTNTTGRITGRIVDATTGAGIAEVGVQVVGTNIGGMSGVDGRYSLGAVPAGTVTLQARRLGFAAKSVTGIFLEAGKTIEQNIALTGSTVQLTATVVTASAERGTVSEALDQQKRATNVVNAVTAEQIARSPDGDAAQAMQRVSGVSVQDGKYLQVRGLGERYTTASLNGARLPSPEPERKVVPLDLFPAGLLQDVTTSKTFTPDQPGDFAGANVNIRTREFPVDRQVTYSMSIGANSRVIGNSLPTAPRAGGELFGLTNATREIPSSISSADFLGAVSQQQFNQIALDQRNVWSAALGQGRPNASFGASVGGNTILGNRIGYLLSGNYTYSQEVRQNERFAVGNQGPDDTVVPLTSVEGTTGRSAVLWGGIANISTLIGRNTKISLNTTATRSADNEARTDRGFDENVNDSIARTTLRYVQRGVLTANLQGEHQLGTRNQTAWAMTYGNTARREPDRSDIVYARNRNGTYQLLGSLDGARRLYFDLREETSVGEVNHTLTVGDVSKQNTLKFGVYHRATDRTADAPIFAFLTRAPESVLELSPSQIFGADQACATCNLINVQPIGQAGSYVASDQTSAAYAMMELSVTPIVRVIAGARVEKADIKVDSRTQGGFTAEARLANTDVLPSLLINTKLTDAQNLRLGVTRTLARPEYRELAPVTFRDVLGGVSVTGNDKLVRTLIDNLDARWEWFPNPGEVVSFGVFAKLFDRPIERLEQATSGAYQATYQNAESATNYGVEMELRKELEFLGRWARPLSGFTNVTAMRSSVQLDTTRGVTVTDVTRRMVGQAPYVANAGVTYSSRTGSASATLLYNVVGERIIAAGVQPLPNIVEPARHVVDGSLRFPLRGGVTARFDAKNLLDARYRFMQGNLEREGYDAGRVFSLGLTLKQ